MLGLCDSEQVGDPKFIFEGKTIRRMELLVMSSLNWKMKACTPCSFIDYFLGKINGDDQIQSGFLISRSIQLILSTIKGSLYFCVGYYSLIWCLLSVQSIDGWEN